MSIEINVPVPDLGINEFEVTEILVKVGDKVDIEQPLITVEGDKASIEIPAPFSGEVKEIKVSKGEKVKTGLVMMIFNVVSTSASTTTTNMSNPTTTSECNNNNRTSCEADREAGIGIDQLSESSASAHNHNNKHPNQNESELLKNKDKDTHATPLIRRLARIFGINISKINGTGRKGRILREDIQNYVTKMIELAERTEVERTKIGLVGISGSSVHGILPWPEVHFGNFGEIEEIDIGRIQKISSANLSRNWVMIPHVTIMEDADITELELFRKTQNKEMEKLSNGTKLTILVFVMKAVAHALEEMPRFNSSISADNKRLILKKYVHIGIAVDTPNGLVVPVIRDVNKKGIIKLSQELIEISKKSRTGKLNAFDMQGGSFTISSLGSIGSTRFTPIINAPEVAIMGISRASMKPVWNGNEFVPRLVLPMSISFDHRVIDGADGARFANRIANLIKDIRNLVM